MTYRINLSKIKTATAGELVSTINRKLTHLLVMHPFITEAPRHLMTEQKWFIRRIYTEIQGNMVAYRVENIPMTPEQRRTYITK
jgi:hypothetical protein